MIQFYKKTGKEQAAHQSLINSRLPLTSLMLSRKVKEAKSHQIYESFSLVLCFSLHVYEVQQFFGFQIPDQLKTGLMIPWKGEQFRWLFHSSGAFLIVNPLSVITLSFSCNKSNSPLLIVICLSETRPPYPSDTKEMIPDGVIPIRNLKAAWCLYLENFTL